MDAMVWLAVMIILIVIEIITVGLTTIWFAGGAIVAMIVSALGGGTVLQISMFLAVSFVLVVFTRPIALKYITSKRVKTNYEGIIGKIVRITQDVDNINGTGCAVVNGQEWTVRAADDDRKLATGSLAKLVNISGVKLIVEQYEEEMTV